MSRPSLGDIKKLFHEVIIPFHEIERDTTLPLPNHRSDNDAEHSWSLSLMAISLAPEIDIKLDLGLICIYATIHDLVEVYAGDTSVWANDKILVSKKDRETKALEKLKSEFPKFLKMIRYIEDYQKLNTNEARFVYALDKFLNILCIVEDNGYYYKINKITKQRYQAQLASHKLKAHLYPAIGTYYDELRIRFDKDPNHFYKK